LPVGQKRPSNLSDGLGMPARKRPMPGDAVTARQILLDGLAWDDGIGELVTELAPVHPRHDTFPREVFLRLAADVLDWCGGYGFRFLAAGVVGSGHRAAAAKHARCVLEDRWRQARGGSAGRRRGRSDHGISGHAAGAHDQDCCYSAVEIAEHAAERGAAAGYAHRVEVLADLAGQADVGSGVLVDPQALEPVLSGVPGHSS
jgi:hypothetical protein